MDGKQKCPACKKAQTDTEMVQCDSCEAWVHYKCAGVDDSVTAVSWLCEACGGDKYTNPVKKPPTLEDLMTAIEKQQAALEERDRREEMLRQELVDQQEAFEKLSFEYDAMKRLQTPGGKAKDLKHAEGAEDSTKRRDNDDQASKLSERFERFQLRAEELNKKAASRGGGASSASSDVGSKASVSPRAPVDATSVEALNKLAIIMQQANVEELPKFSGNIKEWPLFLSVFKRTTKLASIDAATNVGRLQKALLGEARELVIDQLTYGLSANDIIETLKLQYGREDEVLETLSADLLALPVLSGVKDARMKKFAVALKTFVSQLVALGMENELNNNLLATQLKKKLVNAPSMYVKWGYLKRSDPTRNIKSFAEFVMEQWQQLPRESISETKKAPSSDSRPKPSTSRSVHVHSTKENEENQPCFACNENHDLVTCVKFLDATVSERWEFARRRRICFACLSSKDHQTRDCPKRGRCDFPGCDKPHHKLLHFSSGSGLLRGSLSTNGSRKTVDSCHQSHDGDDGCLAKVVAVKLYGRDGIQIQDFAFLDDGSSLTMMDRSLANELGLEGELETLRLRWTKGITRVEQALKSDVVISSQAGGECFTLKGVYCVPSLDLAEIDQKGSELALHHKHLHKLPLPDFKAVRPRLLIGLEHASFLGGSRTIEGKIGEPIAAKTKLGWVVYGKLTSGAIQVEHNPALRTVVQNVHCRLGKQVADEETHALVNSFFAIEGIGVSQKQLRSFDDQRAERLMHDSIRFVNGRYEIGLLWRKDDEKLPDNYAMAVKRLHSEERKLKRDPESLQWMNEHVDQLLKKGYARVATEEDLNTDWPRVWICPFFTVINHNKVPPKRRCVADVAAEHAKVSLNGCLLKGPDNLIALPAALCRARERRVMVTADVAEMFHQIRITKVDQQCQRFLWRNGDESQQPTVYIMEAMMFGPTCSPSISQFVKNFHAEKYRAEIPEAVDAIQKLMYMDDYFNSHDTEEEAEQRTNQAIKICADMSFDLVQIQSNNTNFLKRMPQRNLKAEFVNLSLEESATFTSKLLGMFWKPAGDEFVFKRSFGDLERRMVEENYCPTKREVLSCLMRFFDPLGLAAKYIVRGKWLLQDVWKEKIEWDQFIPPELAEEWIKFLQSFDFTERISISRWYGFVTAETKTVELITFVDASDKAFAAVCYFRFTTRSRYHVALAMAKSKVAPVKPMSIPRLELEAAKIGARLAKTVEELHSFEISRRIFLSDSKCVLAWINSTKFDFTAFVNHRVSEILDLTNPDEWFYVPTHENVADEATKETDNQDNEHGSRWFNGPAFLIQETQYWPILRPTTDSESIMVERKRAKSVMTHQMTIERGREHVLHQFHSQFRSDWNKLTRVLGRVMRLTTTKIELRFNLELTAEELACSEREIFRLIQRETFAELYGDLCETLNANKERQEVELRPRHPSSLANFVIFMKRSDRLIRIASRDRTSSSSYSAKHPVVLPRSHELVELYLKKLHENNFHMGVEATIADARERVWIISVRQALKKVIATCQYCKNRRARPCLPPLGFLHESRTKFDVKPFSYVGVDCFGPITVRERRNEVKRWGVIFTCLSFRAVHLEVIVDLSADQMILAIRRLIARRGPLITLYSDNGTNFVGAANTLARENVQRQQQLSANVVRRFGVDWKFIPAYSPWVGGAWERLISYIKKCMKFCLAGETPSDIVLNNALIEAEIITNKRPLTHSPIDPEDDVPLSPNIALFGITNPDQAECPPEDAGKFAKANRRRVAHLAEKFRLRWEREYVPVIAKAAQPKVGRQARLGDVVLLAEGTSNVETWKLGRIIKIHPSSDDVPRIVDVLMGNGDVKPKRSVGNLALLEVGESTSERSTSATGGRMSPSQ